MASNIKKDIISLLTLYTIEELAGILGVTSRSISSYKDGENPSKKTKNRIIEVVEAVANNGGKRVALDGLRLSPQKVSAEGVLLKVLVEEVAQIRAEKEGRSTEAVIKEIENKARLVLNVVGNI